MLRAIAVGDLTSLSLDHGGMQCVIWFLAERGAAAPG